MAEFIFKKMVKDAHLNGMVEICSRATSCEEILAGRGNPVYPPAVRQLQIHGIPMEEKFAERITTEECRQNDIIVVMDDNNLRNMEPFIGADKALHAKMWKMLDFESIDSPKDASAARLTGDNIADPWYTGNFPLSYSQIERGCKGLLNYVLYLSTLLCTTRSHS